MKTEEKQIQKDCPRTYQMDKSTRRFVHWFGIFLVVFFVGMTPLHLFGVMKNPMSPLTLALTDVFVIVGATWAFLRANRRVILYDDAIEVAGPFLTRKLSRSEILGRRMGKLAWQAGGGSYYIIVPVDGSKKELKLPPFLNVDEFFFTWMKAIPQVGM
jgi:hypothetical protein